MQIKDRIRGYLPVVVDIETGGFNNKTDAILEICAVVIAIDQYGVFYPKDFKHFHVRPFKNANLESAALKFNGIDVNNPLRMAVSEKQALSEIFQAIHIEIKNQDCTRAILVGHNSFFDLGFLYAASKRSKTNNPFHKFSTIDTVSLSALYYGETVLAKAMSVANIEWNDANAHSALYDAQKTAELFCQIFNEQQYS